MFKIILPSLAAATIAATAGLAADTVSPAELKPVTPWKVDFDDAGCSIERRFASADGDVTVRLLRRGVNGGVDMLLLGSLIPRLPTGTELQIDLGPQGRQFTIRTISGKTPETSAPYLRGFVIGFVAGTPWTTDQTVRISADRKLDLPMRWTDAKAVFDVLQQCDDDFFGDQGIDMKALRAQITPPKLLNDPRFEGDPPARVKKRGNDPIVGQAFYEVKVDVTGAVLDCQKLWADGVSNTFGPCEYAMTQKYTPAVGADGKPASGYLDDVAIIRRETTVTAVPR